MPRLALARSHPAQREAIKNGQPRPRRRKQGLFAGQRSSVAYDDDELPPWEQDAGPGAIKPADGKPLSKKQKQRLEEEERQRRRKKKGVLPGKFDMQRWVPACQPWA